MTASEQGPPPVVTGGAQETNLAAKVEGNCAVGKSDVAAAAVKAPSAATTAVETPPPPQSAAVLPAIEPAVAPPLIKPSWPTILRQALLTANQLSTLEVPVREYILDPYFKVADYGIIHAQRGVGKTWLGYGIASAASEGGNAGPWKAPKARRVLLVDGEMPLELTKERDAQFPGGKSNLIILHHQRLFDMFGVDLNLVNPQVQSALEEICVEEKIELLILDNQSSLMPGALEKDPDQWDKIQPWLLRLQRRGIAVLLIVHAGRNNNARGHSRREDRASWIIGLTDRKDDEAPGAKFVSEFVKPSRNCPADKTPCLLWEFSRGEDGKTTISCTPLSKLDQFRQCLENGVGDDPTAIAEDMKISLGYVSRLATKGMKAGWCRKEGRGYALVS